MGDKSGITSGALRQCNQLADVAVRSGDWRESGILLGRVISRMKEVRWAGNSWLRLGRVLSPYITQSFIVSAFPLYHRTILIGLGLHLHQYTGMLSVSFWLFTVLHHILSKRFPKQDLTIQQTRHSCTPS